MKTHRRNFSAKQRAAALRNLRKARAAHRPNRRRGKARRGLVSNRKRTVKRARKNASKRTHRRNFSAKQRAAALRNLRKARAAQHRPNRRRSHKKNRRRSSAKRHKKNIQMATNRRRSHKKNRRRAHKKNTRRTHRRNFSAKQRAAALRNLRKARAAQHRPNRRRSHKKNRRRSSAKRHKRNGMMSNRRRSHKKNRRRSAKRNYRRNFTAKQRAAALRNLRKARAAQHRPNRRRSHKKNRRRSSARHKRNGMMSNRRRSRKNAHRRNSGRRLRMNGKAFRKNEFMATAKAVLKIGAITTAGFVGHKIVTKFFTDKLLDRLIGSSGAVTPPAPAATSGLEALQPYRSVLGGAVIAALGVYGANRFVKDVQTKMFLTAGIATSFVHSLAVAVISRMAPSYSGYLSGHDATSVRLAAMYGLGSGASIMPQYHGLGEYFAQNGLGEYFAQNGLGAYTGNPDLMQAAAGYGTVDNPNSNIIDPGSNLDQQLSIAEAAAGVGAVAPYEAAAGFGRVQPFEAAAGFGSVVTVPPTADTWIPGSSQAGELWAGTVAINQGQSANEMDSAGILETAGNQGVFG